MTVRVVFHEELRRLEDRLFAMSANVTDALEASIAAVLAADHDLAREIIAGDEAINALHLQITQDTLQVIATQNPMASDLREVLSIASIASDVERVGDYEKGIAKLTLRLDGPVEGAQGVKLAHLGDVVRSVLSDALDAMVAQDEAAARAAARRDDQIDELYARFHHDGILFMMEHPERVRPVEAVMWAAKSLERIGDHVTNICEWIVFRATGDLVDLNG